MYKKIEAQIILSGLSKHEIADKLGIRYNTLLLKLNDKSNFTLDEAIKLKDLIQSPESIEELFTKTD